MNEHKRHPLIPAGRVNGTEVFSSAGDKLGHIEDVVIDKISGTIAYAILSTGGYLGVIGERFQPMPWSLLDYDPDRRGYVAPMKPEDVNKAPQIDRSKLSGWDDAESRQAIYDHYSLYGANPFW